MTSAAALGTVALLTTACFGFGGMILRLLRILPELSVSDRFAWSFATGFAALGWILFYPALAGALSTQTLFAVCACGSIMMIAFLRTDLPNAIDRATPESGINAITAVLIIGIGIVVSVDLLEGLSPPVEADSLAYHFELPKRYLEAGRLFFVPQAIDGAPPQLVHMTYMAALQLGGERGLTLWTMASGWMTALILYVIARRWLSINWSLTVTLIYLSTPAILQTGGTGHVEPRLAQFVLTGALACGIAMQRNSARYAALAGISAGAFAAAKYTGLLFGAACFLALLFRKGRVAKVSAFAAAGFILAFQWYLWAWINTGDPLFPMLYNLVGTKDPGLWSNAQNAVFRTWISETETPIPTVPWWFLFYPIYATFVYDPALENGRSGLGVFGFLTVPFVVGYLLNNWRSIRLGPLFYAGIILMVAYALWFFGGAPQRVRHLVPFYPLALLGLTAAAVRWATRTNVVRPLAAGAVLCITFQLGGQIIYGWEYGRHIFSGEARAAFLRRNVSMYAMVPLLNTTLDRHSRVVIFERQLLYLIDVPTEMSHPVLRRSINFELLRDRPRQLFDELRAAGVTHVADTGLVANGPDAMPVPSHEGVRRLFRSHCLAEVRRAKGTTISSRTLQLKAAAGKWVFLFALTPGTCKP